MPLITIKVFENELDETQSEALIEKITDSVASVTSEKLRPATWVMIEEIKDKHWAIGGKGLALDDVKKMIAS
jgi:4-oxalocrotonate tautomerase